MNDGVTGLHFAAAGGGQSGDSAPEHYCKLKDRSVLEFGAGNVSDRLSFMMP